MNIYILNALLFFFIPYVTSVDHICNFSSISKSTATIKNNTCVINANPFDKVTLICPNSYTTTCFERVNLSDDVKKTKNLVDINTLLYGSVIIDNSLIISPTVIRASTFFCFCNFQDSGKIRKEVKKLPKPKQEKKKKGRKEEEEEEEEVEEEEDEKEEEEEKRLEKIIKKTKKKKSKSSKSCQESKTEDEEELVEEEEEEEEEEVTHVQEIGNNRFRLMKVVVSKEDYKTKGCDFGHVNSNYFTRPFPIEQYGGSRVCKIKAKPGEFVGFKCIFDSEGYVEPRNCFNKVLYNNNEVNLSDIIPGGVSYSNELNSYYALYLKLPHFINSNYTIQCKCKSTVYDYNDYVFELEIEGGESEIVKNSFR